ncbi:hypothetical protein ABZ754_15595 [Micromonospora purpureochromogenes]|uniref:hypothetical protein n=1 Tax=Micromonospora purpureochromogenes TaxID=47872 RepID=UPI0033DFA29B
MPADRHPATTTATLLSYATRGALVGVGVAAAWLAAAAYASRSVEARLAAETATDAANGSGVAALGDEVAHTVGIGLPATLLLGLLVAWGLRLPRPWAVPLVGALLTGVLCGGTAIVLSSAGQGEPLERSAVPLSVVVVAHLVAAPLVARGAPTRARRVGDGGPAA